MKQKLERAKGILFHAALRSMLFTTRIVGFRGMHLIMSAVAAIGLKGMVFPLWAACLQRLNRRAALVEWTKPKKGKPSLRDIYFHIRALNLIRDFGSAAEIHEKALREISPLEFVRKTKWHDKLRVERNIFLYEKISPPFVKGYGEHERVLTHFYQRIWEAHGYKDMPLVEKYVQLYCSFAGHDPQIVMHLTDNVLFPNGQHELAHAICSKALSLFERGSKGLYGKNIMEFLQSAHLWQIPEIRKLKETRAAQHIRQGLLNRMRIAECELGQPCSASMQEDPAGKLLQMIHTDVKGAGAYESARDILTYLEHFMLSDIHEEEKSRIAHLALAEAAERFEISGKYDLALIHYEKALQFEKENWVSECAWRYVSLLYFMKRNAEANRFMLEKLKLFWRNFSSVSRTGIERRIKKGKLLHQNAFILAGWGIGDIIISLGILQHLRPANSRYGCGGDPRLKELLEPGNEDWLEIVPSSRTTGPFAVDERQYWSDREGVPAGLDQHRVTRTIMRKMKQYRDVMLAEDVFVAGLVQGLQFQHATDPLIKLTEEEVEPFREWLDSLPGKVKVGFSWRSGELNLARNKSYTEIEQWEKLFQLEGVDVISLQYSDTSEEKRVIAEQFGGTLHEHPHVHLTNDLRKICALAKACDLVVAPCTAVRDMAGACGANTISLTITPVAPDWWRIAEDGMTDRIFPTITHFSYLHHGSKQGVVDAVIHKIQEMAAP